MGEDGAKRVVVNSLGREIRTLEEEPPTEGKRLQLTIDYDVQKAVEDGFKASARLQRRARSSSIRTTARCSRSPAVPAYDPNAFAAGIDRATWASLNTDELRPLQRSRDSGSLLARIDVQDGRGAGGARGRRDHARLQRVLRRRRHVLRPHFKCWKKGGHGTVDLRHAIEQSCNVYFYTVGNMLGVDKINKWADAARARREERHRPAKRGHRARAVHRVEAGAARTRSGTPARRSRCRSARARCR